MDAITSYKNNAVLNQSPGQLVVTLYDGAIKFLNQALVELEAGNYAEKGRLICKAMDIVVELNCCLDMETGGEMAMNLRKLYHFMHRHLAEANAKKDPQRIREVINLLKELNEGWRAICT